MSRKKKYEPVGHCIYCGGTDRLSDEHIVPYALNGDLILPKASCEPCRLIIEQFEVRVLRGPMRAFRAVRNIRSRNPAKRPTTDTVTIVRDGKQQDVELPLAEFPVGLHFQKFAPPTVLGGEKVSGITLLTHDSPFIQFSGPPMEVVKQRLGADQIWVRQTYKPIEFARLIAKIAYSFAFAEGAEGLIKYGESPVVRVILGETGEIGHWVGSMTEPLTSIPGSLHELYVAPGQDGRGLLVGQVKLFADLPSPRYGVILGTL
jgi:hypothetical protein